MLIWLLSVLWRPDCESQGCTCYGDVIFCGLLPEDGYKPLYRHWYWYRNGKQGKSFWTEPYLDEGGANVPIITHSVPMHADGVFVGVVTMDIPLQPGSTLGTSKIAAFEDPDTANPSRAAPTTQEHDKGVTANDAAKARAKLDGLAEFPRQAARKITAKLSDSSSVITDEFVKGVLKEVMEGEGVFGTCIAFEPSVYNGLERKVIYCKQHTASPHSSPTHDDHRDDDVVRVDKPSRGPCMPSHSIPQARVDCQCVNRWSW